ncbi:HAMP domain-containing protein [Myxococcota bacterium]|nr:HAMP domain-containing protein [Myxococcota bacterium]MBU1429142.1 HAMP domain-containing protein [Myxococcota bacterium]MBU1898988.1 HAMP domain-containing protein [Myxococcota bacterium]
MDDHRAEARRVTRFFLAAFLVPPAAWLPLIWYIGLVSLEEMLQVGMGAALWSYVAIWLGFALWVHRRLQREILIGLGHLRSEERCGQACAAIARAPRFTAIALLLYAAIGPSVATLGHDFLDPVERQIAIFTGLPLVLVLSLPFYLAMLLRLERWTKAVPLNPKDYFHLSTRVIIASLVPSIGALIVLCASTASLLRASPQMPIGGIITRMAVLAALSALAIFVVIRGLNRQLEAQLKETVRLAAAVSRGDLACRAPTLSRDELGLVTAALNQTIGHLDEIVSGRLGALSLAMGRSGALLTQTAGDLNARVEGLSQGASEVRQISQALAEEAGGVARTTVEAGQTLSGAAQQSQEISARLRSINHASESITHMTLGVSSATAQMSATLQDITRGASRVADASQASRERVEETRAAVAHLTQAMSQIHDILDLLDDISDQTDLLALNATIAAATAGEAGRGFAVVAHEVGELAHRASGATEQSRAALAEMDRWMRSVTEHVSVMADGVSEVSASASLIAQAVRDQSEATEEIAHNIDASSAALSELAEDTEEISGGVTRIAGVLTQLNAGLTHIAHAAATVAGQTQRVEAAVEGISSELVEVEQAAANLSDAAGEASAERARLEEIMASFVPRSGSARVSRGLV